ncbi:hypothetical protein FB451DRAFT_1218126 [Mycena latifolia]|nr:hypothetical protein FB451DRAFT_1218126 [Mycena latifolia]
MNLRNFILQAYPNTFHISLIAISTALSLTLTASFIPLTLTLTMLLVYAPILLHRPHRFAYTTLLWIFITLCGSFARLVPTLDALSTAGTSVAVLLSITSFSSALAIFAIFLDVGIRMRTGTPQAVLFPAIWMTLWAAASHMPLGRLISWSPVLGIQSYSWMVPWVGPGGIDWLVAAWAVVISQSIGIWYMGNSEDEEVSTTKTTSSSSGTFILTVILAALTIPAFIISSSPLPVNPPETITQLTLGCALPPHHDTSPTLSDYIAESNSIHHTTTTLILWPEGAVSFRNATDRDAGFKHIQKSIGQRGTYWAVSFEETIPDPSDASNRTSISRTGVAILSDSSIHHPVYYKRHLVPIAESFPFTPGSSPPSSYTLALHRPKNVPKAHWGPSTRPLELTSSICLDFAMPSPFRDLDSRPALILAPARTWDPAIGARMWEEVKQRANEIGSLALWCDGGKGGVSGVAGAGYNDVYQVGEGSWSRTVGIAYPFDPTRTFYARSGDALVFAASWLFVIGPIGFWLVLAQYSKVAERLHGMGIKCFEWVTQNRRRTPPAANLIDFGD